VTENIEAWACEGTGCNAKGMTGTGHGATVDTLLTASLLAFVMVYSSNDDH